MVICPNFIYSEYFASLSSWPEIWSSAHHLRILICSWARGSLALAIRCLYTLGLRALLIVTSVTLYCLNWRIARSKYFICLSILEEVTKFSSSSIWSLLSDNGRPGRSVGVRAYFSNVYWTCLFVILRRLEIEKILNFIFFSVRTWIRWSHVRFFRRLGVDGVVVFIIHISLRICKHLDNFRDILKRKMIFCRDNVWLR